MVRTGKQSYKKIGLTIGVWDLFHEGHRKFLNNCLKHCDQLVIGVMTDYWVRVQKGHDRPAESLQKRMHSVSDFCWRTIPVDTLDMSQYLQIVDVWIKGEDQRNMKPDFFENTVYIERTPGISTSILIEGD